MTITCPTDPSHKRFSVSAHVSEEWEVDESGSWQKTLGFNETIVAPNSESLFSCLECGAEGIAKD